MVTQTTRMDPSSFTLRTEQQSLVHEKSLETRVLLSAKASNPFGATGKVVLAKVRKSCRHIYCYQEGLPQLGLFRVGFPAPLILFYGHLALKLSIRIF